MSEPQIGDKIKIISEDGIGQNAKIMHDDKILTSVTKAVITMSVDKLNEVELTIAVPEVEIEAIIKGIDCESSRYFKIKDIVNSDFNESAENKLMKIIEIINS